MKDEAILEVGVGAGGRLFVRPAQSRFDRIFRAAMGVDWDDERGALLSPEPREWPLGRWFEQILSATVDEYGVALRLTHSAQWTRVVAELQRDIENFASSNWLPQYSHNGRKMMLATGKTTRSSKPSR